MNQSERRTFLIHAFLSEKPQYRKVKVPSTPKEQEALLRGLMNVREPQSIDEAILDIQDAYLQEALQEKGITSLDSLVPIRDGIYLWQGDITTLQCDAIVNSANADLTGCYIPNQACVDNCIHTYAGIQLRKYCNDIIQEQGHIEFTGQAKITPAYNLPCKYILHTVGPIVTEPLADYDRDMLTSCYQSCLDLASQRHLESVAFCCIATGSYHFPHEEAAQIAVQTVLDFLQEDTQIKKVIFTVFQDQDKAIYEKLLQA